MTQSILKIKNLTPVSIVALCIGYAIYKNIDRVSSISWNFVGFFEGEIKFNDNSNQRGGDYTNHIRKK